MLARAVLGRPVAAARRALHTTASLASEGDKIQDLSPMGIDRNAPLFAPSYRREWKHAGFGGANGTIVNADNPAEWREWEDLPAPYKYYHIKLDPADVEKTSFFYGLMNDWRTAIPMGIAVGFPVFAYDIVFMDYHVELAGIALATLGMAIVNIGPGIRKMISADILEAKDTLYKAEAEYFEAIDETMTAYSKVQDAPQLSAHLNAGERALRGMEAAAKSVAIKTSETARMAEMLDYLVTLKGSSAADSADIAAVLAHRAAEASIEGDKSAQQATIADAIAALQKGGAPLAGNTAEKAFAAAFENVQKNPPKPDPAVAAAELERADDIFAKRFGLSSRTVTANDIKQASGDAGAWAILTAKVGGAEPEVGATLTDPNPLAFRK